MTCRDRRLAGSGRSDPNEVRRTQSLSLSLRILGIPVKAGPSIVVGLLFIGVLSRLSGAFLVEWVVLGLIALLLHELGHGVAFRRYGVASSISFWGLGGLTMPDDVDAAERMTDRQMVVVALAGPAVSIVIGVVSLAALFALRQFSEIESNSIRVPISIWLFVNLGWGIFNLLPIASLDGGRAVSHFIGAILPGRLGIFLGASANIVASLVLAALALQFGQPYIAFIAVLFGLASPDLYVRLIDAVVPGWSERREKRQLDEHRTRTDLDELGARDRLGYTDRPDPVLRGDPRFKP